jgi:hypothetical protein
MRKSVGQIPTAGEQTQQKPCRTCSDIGAELENYTVGRGPMWDRKGLKRMELLDSGLESALTEGVNKAVCTDETSVCVLSDVASC